MAGTRRAAVTVLDQGFASISNFAVTVAVARAAGASGLGGFSLAYAGWLVLAAMHRSLVTDPMAIEGDARDRRATAGIKQGLAAEVLLGLAAAIGLAILGASLMLARQRTFGFPMLALAPWLPVLLAQDYWRWVGFMSRQPGRSLANDTVFNCVQGAALAAVFILHVHSVAALIASWGLGGASGAVYGLYQYRILPSFTGGFYLLRARWSVSKWIATSSLTNWGASQAYVFIVGVLLGPAGLGALKAAQTLVVGPAGVLIQAGGSIGLPEASRAYGDKGWTGLMRVCRVVTVAGFLSFGTVAVVVSIWGRTLLSHIYGPAFAHMELAAVIIGVGYTLDGFCLGPVLVFKATRTTRWLLRGQILNFVSAFCSTAALAVAFGINGAAAAFIVTGVVCAVGYRWFQHRAHRSLPLDQVIGGAPPLGERGAGSQRPSHRLAGSGSARQEG